jgi:uncharacterized protein
MKDKNKIGTFGWYDLSVNDAEKVSSFYSEVVGWKKEGLSMGDYDDYVMKAPNTDEGVAGVCHARGNNAYIPPQWLLYVYVENLDQSLEKCVNLGGKIIGTKRKMGESFYCLIQDPEGAHLMLWEE